MNTLHVNSNTVFNPLEDCPYTVQEVCDIERLSPAKVRAMCQSGELPGAYKASNASGWRIPRQALEAKNPHDAEQSKGTRNEHSNSPPI